MSNWIVFLKTIGMDNIPKTIRAKHVCIVGVVKEYEDIMDSVLHSAAKSSFQGFHVMTLVSENISRKYSNATCI